MDAGYRTAAVTYVCDHFDKPLLEANKWRVNRGCLMPTRGNNVAWNERLIMGAPGGKTAKGQKKQYRTWRLGVDNVKRELYQILNNKEMPVYGRPHAPLDYPDSHFEELVAEQIIARPNPQTKKVQMVFHLPPGRRNEALDLHVMNRFVITVMGADEWQEKDWLRVTPKPSSGQSETNEKMKKRRENREKRLQARKNRRNG